MPLSTPPPPAPVPVLGPIAGLLTEQSTPLGIFLALARIGMAFLAPLLHPLRAAAGRYPRHWRALVESTIALLRVLLTVRFAPERITVAQFRKLWRARQLFESLTGGPLPCFHSSPLGARTPSSTNATANQSPAASPEHASALGTPISRLASAPAPSISQPSPPSVPQVPCCSLSPSRSDAHSSSAPRSRSQKRAPASLQSIIAMMESSDANPPSSSPRSALHTPRFSISPFIPDVTTLRQALEADTLLPNCAGALLDKPADTLIKALQQVHALIHAFPQLSPSPSPSSGNPQSSICNLQSSPSPSQSPSNPQSAICDPQSAIDNPQSKGEDPVGLRDHNPQSDAPP